MERDNPRTLAKKRPRTFPVDLNVPAVITSGQNEIGDDNGDSIANKTVQTISNITGSTASTFQGHASNQVGTSSGTHTGPYMSLLLGLDGRNLDEIPVDTIDDMVPRSQISYPRGNEGGSISYLGQARSFSLPTTHEHFLYGSAGGMASALPSNSTSAGHMQSRAANIMGSVLSSTNMQSPCVGGSVPPGLWGGFQSRILQSPVENTGTTLLPHSLGNTFSGNNPVSDRTWFNRSPSPLLVGNYSGMVSNVPTGFMSKTNAGQYAYQLAGSPNDSRWRDYGAMASLNHYWSYQNQFSSGGTLRASPANNAAPRTWFHMGGHNYQTIVPQQDASFLGTGLAGNGTGGSQSLTYNPRVDNMNSDVIILNDDGQSSEQTATHDLNSIMEGAVRGAYEFDYWIKHGRPPSPTQASSSVPPLPSGSSPAPDQSQEENTEQLVSIANEPLSVPEPSPSFPSPISDKQAGKAIVSPSNEAAGSTSFQNNSDPTYKDHVSQQNPIECNYGTQAVPIFTETSGNPFGQSTLFESSHAIGVEQSGSICGALPEALRFIPCWSSPTATHPHPAIVESSDDMAEPLGYKCPLCNVDLALKPTRSSFHAVMVHVVLPCGHSYHSSCFEEIYGFVGRNEDPPCFCCSEGGAWRS